MVMFARDNLLEDRYGIDATTAALAGVDELWTRWMEAANGDADLR